MIAFFAASPLAAIVLSASLAHAPVEPLKSPLKPVNAAAAASPLEHKIYGRFVSKRGTLLYLQLRTGRLLAVDASVAHSAVLLRPGRAIIVFGSLTPNGALRARAIWRSFPDAAHWPADR
jgi:hypothetical protein